MRLDFTKMHGLGNDFLVLDATPGAALPTAQQWRMLADRHTGVGFDQALVLEPPRRADSQVYYRIFNADGLEVEQCGNGARCIAQLLKQTGRARLNGAGGELLLDSPAGAVRARIDAAGLVSVDMGEPNFEPRSLPFTADAQARRYEVDVPGERVELAAVSMGNPHVVLQVPDVASAPVARLGPLLETHVRFPKRVNVGFMQILSPAHIQLRVFERGVGETLACGTGACAAVAVGRRDMQLEADVRVQLPGGMLQVHWAGPGEPLWLAGPAEVSFHGQVEI